MHAALIIDEERLTHEHAMLRRLCVGLIDQGMRLTRIVPETLRSEAATESEGRIALTPAVRTQMKVLPWWRRARVDRLAEHFERDTPDVLYAIGRDSWTLALDLAEAIERPIALNVWSPRLLKEVPRPGGRRGRRIGAYVAASAPLAAALGKRIDPSLIALVPMGAPVRKKARSIFSRYPHSIGIAVIGACDDLAAYEAMLAGLARLLREPSPYPGLQTVMELRGGNCHDVWRIARRHDLLGSVCGIEDAAQHRGLLTQCDLILMPERRGELTSLLLEAMACGLAVIARDDPFLDVVEDGATGLTVKGDSADEWAEVIQQLLDDPEKAKQIGIEGRIRVRNTHRSADQVSRLAATLEWMAGGGAYPFHEAR